MTASAPVQRRTRVKICGVTNQEDAEAAIAAGADALGFNTWQGTKRWIDLKTEAAWLQKLPPFITKVALLVNASLAEAEQVARMPFIDALQLHGDEDEQYCAKVAEFGRPFVKALRVRSEADLDCLDRFSTPYFLIDAHVPGLFGGTGVKADLGLAAEFQRRYPGHALILAGGLRPDNVGEAVRRVSPYAVDVSSGVEADPRRKDVERMRKFVDEVWRAGGAQPLST